MTPTPNTPKEPEKCSAETAGYDGMFGIYCSLPAGHKGLHNDSDWVEWDFVDAEFRNSTDPPQTNVPRTVAAPGFRPDPDMGGVAPEGNDGGTGAAP